VPSSSRPNVTPPRPRSQGKQALAVWVWILGFCLAALIATYILFVEPPPLRKIVIASGGQNGAYFHYARKYAEELQKEGLSVEVRETAGSVENLHLLGQEGSGVSVAIVQSGVASPAEDAKHFYESGQPVLQRLLHFWLASLVDRAKVMLISLIILTMPLLRAAPPLMRWRRRRKIYLWYSDLRAIDQRLVAGLLGPELDQELARLKDIEHQVAYVDVPLSYVEEFYHLRLHLGMLQQHLIELRAGIEPPIVSTKP